MLSDNPMKAIGQYAKERTNNLLYGVGCPNIIDGVEGLLLSYEESKVVTPSPDVPAKPKIPLHNFSSQSVQYKVDNETSGIIEPAETLQITLGDNITLNFLVFVDWFGLVNQTNTIMTRVGGGVKIEETEYTWNIPSNSTLLNIAGIP